MTEKRIALTTDQLIEKTRKIYNGTYTSKQILETYLNPLINQNYIDKTESELDRRANTYYPAGLTSSAVTTAATASEQKLEQQISKYIKLFENCETNNFSHHIKVVITDPILYPNKEYLISKIHG